MRRPLLQDEGSIRELVERRVVVPLRARAGIDALAVQLRVDRVHSDLSGMERAPDLREAFVIRSPAERAGAMTGGEGGRLVEEERAR